MSSETEQFLVSEVGFLEGCLEDTEEQLNLLQQVVVAANIAVTNPASDGNHEFVCKGADGGRLTADQWAAVRRAVEEQQMKAEIEAEVADIDFSDVNSNGPSVSEIAGISDEEWENS